MGGCDCPPPLVERRVDGELLCEFLFDGGPPLPDDDAGTDAGTDLGVDAGCVGGESCVPEESCQLGAQMCVEGQPRCVATGPAPDGAECTACATDNCVCDAGACEARLLGESEYLKASNAGAFDEFGGSFGVGLAISADGNTLVAGAIGEATSGGGVNPERDDLMPGSGAAYVFERRGEGWEEVAMLKAPEPVANDGCGSDVAISRRGDVIAVGCARRGTERRGEVLTFIRSDDSWEPDDILVAPGASTEDRFGLTLAIANDGQVIAVGAPGEDSSIGGVDPPLDARGNRTGAAFVFRRIGAGWELDAVLKAPVPENTAVLGRVALSADGTVLAAAATGETESGVADAGAIYVYSYSPVRTDQWRFEQRLVSPTPENGAFFGNQLSLSGSGRLLAVSAHRSARGAPGVGFGSGAPVTDSGSVFTYERTAELWELQQRFRLPEVSEGDTLGTGLSLADGGDLLVIGSPGEGTLASVGRVDAQNDDRPGSGCVAVFRRGESTWMLEALLKHPLAAEADGLGSSVAVTPSGHRVIASAPGEDARRSAGDGEASQSGAVFVIR
ncbi:MAG: hypothetical protein AAGH15_04190 [Myxococcota bacterium]